jgi:hypothetical protein
LVLNEVEMEARVGIERIPLPQATRNQRPMAPLIY